MALLEILHHPDPRLRKKSKEIKIVDDTLKQLINDMLNTMYAAPGVGLAAPQINQAVRLIVVDVSENKDQPQVLINPKIIEKDGTQIGEEGCLSVPGFYDDIERSKIIKVSALNDSGDKVKFKADDLLAICIQHEIDHLDGKLFVDYLSSMKQKRILKKIKKQEKLNL